MMENVLFFDHPNETLHFFKRLMEFTMTTGVLVIGSLLNILLDHRSLLLTDEFNNYDRLLFVLLAFRVCSFLFQLPIRYRLYNMVGYANLTNNPAEKSRRLLEMINSCEWKFSQTLSMVLIFSVLVILLITSGAWWLFLHHDFRRKMLHVLIWSVLLLICQIIVSVYWLTRILNGNGAGSPLNEDVLEYKFETAESMLSKLKNRDPPFDRIPEGIEDEAALGIFHTNECSICKASFTSPPTSPKDPASETPAAPAEEKAEEEENDPEGTPPIAPTLIQQAWQILDREGAEAAEDEAPSRTPPNQIALLPCGHTFHPKCLVPWLQNHPRCPFCSYHVQDDVKWIKGRRTRASAPTSSGTT